MKKGASRKVIRYDRLINALRGLAASLPTTVEKEEILASSKAVVDFLLELRTQLELIPSTEDLASAERAIARLEELVESSARKPALAAVIGQAARQGAAARQQTRDRGRREVEASLEVLQKLPIDEIDDRLRGPSYSMTRLREMAFSLGLRPAKDVDREALVHQIAMSIANYRGYQQMSGQSTASDVARE
jgi:hypothetical protein